MMGSYGMMSGPMVGIVMCIFMWLLGLAVIGGVVYFAVKLALRHNKNTLN